MLSISAATRSWSSSGSARNRSITLSSKLVRTPLACNRSGLPPVLALPVKLQQEGSNKAPVPLLGFGI